jgi:hypothetical protein
MIGSSCKKSPPAADPYNLALNTVDQNKKLIQGNWIEDSVHSTSGKLYRALSPSYLRIDTNLNYSFTQTFSSNQGHPDTDTGYIGFDGNRNIEPVSVGLNHYLGNIEKFVITTATDHQLALFAYGIVTDDYTWYFHK